MGAIDESMEEWAVEAFETRTGLEEVKETMIRSDRQATEIASARVPKGYETCIDRS